MTYPYASTRYRVRLRVKSIVKLVYLSHKAGSAHIIIIIVIMVKVFLRLFLLRMKTSAGPGSWHGLPSESINEEEK